MTLGFRIGFGNFIRASDPASERTTDRGAADVLGSVVDCPFEDMTSRRSSTREVDEVLEPCGGASSDGSVGFALGVFLTWFSPQGTGQTDGGKTTAASDPLRRTKFAPT